MGLECNIGYNTEMSILIKGEIQGFEGCSQPCFNAKSHVF
jgi:hypothetical protein